MWLFLFFFFLFLLLFLLLFFDAAVCCADNHQSPSHGFVSLHYKRFRSPHVTLARTRVLPITPARRSHSCSHSHYPISIAHRIAMFLIQLALHNLLARIGRQTRLSPSLIGMAMNKEAGRRTEAVVIEVGVVSGLIGGSGRKLVSVAAVVVRRTGGVVGSNVLLVNVVVATERDGGLNEKARSVELFVLTLEFGGGGTVAGVGLSIGTQHAPTIGMKAVIGLSIQHPHSVPRTHLQTKPPAARVPWRVRTTDQLRREVIQ